MNLSKNQKITLQVSVFIIIGLVFLFQNLNSSVINDFKSIVNEEKSEDYYKLKFALENGCLPFWVTEPKLAKYNGRDVIKSYGTTRGKEYVWYSDLTAENIKTGTRAIWECDGIERLDIVGNPIPTDEEMHQGAIYDNNGNIVADEYERVQRNKEIEQENRVNIQQTTSVNNQQTTNNSNTSSYNEKCDYCTRIADFKIWKGGQNESGSYWGGWDKISEQKTGWVKCRGCVGYGLNWDYNSAERRPESEYCKNSSCVNGWIKCPGSNRFH